MRCRSPNKSIPGFRSAPKRCVDRTPQTANVKLVMHSRRPPSTAREGPRCDMQQVFRLPPADKLPSVYSKPQQSSKLHCCAYGYEGLQTYMQTSPAACAAGHRTIASSEALRNDATPVTKKPPSRRERDMSSSFVSRLDVVAHDMQRMAAALEHCLH
jgi:hypothetical protein